MGRTTSELRLPADPAFIVVVKRAAAGFAAVAGFDVDSCDDLVIAVAQACQNAIAFCRRQGRAAEAQLRLLFSLEDRRLEVHLRTVVGSSSSPPVRVAAERVQEEVPEEASEELALRVMGLFVDECRYRMDARTGGLRVRLIKHRGS